MPFSSELRLGLSYNSQDRLVTSSGSSYSYDGNSLRVKKQVGSGTATVYLFSGTKVIAEYNNGAAPTSPTREYIYSGSALLATLEGTATKYHHRDHLSNRVITDAAGVVVEQRGHLPFGETWYESASSTKWKFTTYERDPESGNDYAMARYYMNRLGRFVSTDPLAGNVFNPQRLNRYAYVLGNPTNLSDPIGLDICDNPDRFRSAEAYAAYCGWSGDGDGGGLSCTLDGVVVFCDMASRALASGAAMLAPRNLVRWNPDDKQWEFFRAYSDGSAGWQPMSLFGNSPAEIAAIQAEISQALNSAPVDHGTLTDWQQELLARLARHLHVDPTTIRIYRTSSGALFAALPGGSYQTLVSLSQSHAFSGFSNDSFFHGSYSVGLREVTNGRDSLHVSMLDFSLTQRFGGGNAVFATWHNDRYNPAQRFWKHTFCDVLKFCH